MTLTSCAYRGVLLCAVIALTTALPATARAQEWKGKVRGSWVREGQPKPDDVTLVEPGKTCQIVVKDDAHSAVKQAAIFLAAHLRKLAGQAIHFAPAPDAGRVSIRMATIGDGTDLPPGAAV